MKARMAVVMLTATVLGAYALAVGGNTNQKPLQIRLNLDLVDGSRIVGTPTIKSVPVQTSYAKMDLPLKEILALRIDTDHKTAGIALRNGDKLTGVITLDPIRLDTVFGKVSIGIEFIREIRVALGVAHVEQTLKEGLILCCAFDGSGEDGSAGGRNLKLIGDIGFVAGRSGQALNLRGDGTQFAVRPNDDAIYNFGTNDFTASVCVNFNQTHGEQTLIEKFSGAAGPGWTLTKLDNNALQFFARPSVVVTTKPIPIPKGVWHNILVRKSGSLCQIMYNGALLTEGCALGPIPDTTAPLLVGKRNPYSGQNFPVDGRIDEVAIWSRALSDDEIAALIGGVQGVLNIASETTR